MTLKQFFDFLSSNPSLILFYAIAVPLSALLTGFFSKGEGHLSPLEVFIFLFDLFCLCTRDLCFYVQYLSFLIRAPKCLGFEYLYTDFTSYSYGSHIINYQKICVLG